MWPHDLPGQPQCGLRLSEPGKSPLYPSALCRAKRTHTATEPQNRRDRTQNASIEPYDRRAPQQNRISARQTHASPHSALNILRTNRKTRRMGTALVDAIFHNEEKTEPIFPPARPNAKRRIAAQTSPRAHKRFCRSCNRPNAILRRPTIHDYIKQSSASPRQRGQTHKSQANPRFPVSAQNRACNSGKSMI